VRRDDGRYQKLTPFPEPNAQPNQQPYPQKTDDNYKHKQEEEENKNKTSGGGLAATPPRREVFSEGMATLEERRIAFVQSLQPYNSEYGPGMVADFCTYWTETNRTGTLMRWELQQTWHTQSRLETWRRKEDKFGKQAPNAPERGIDDYLQQRKRLEERTREIMKGQ